MAKIRFGYSDDFTAKNSKVGINTTEPQTNLDVVGVVKGQDLKVTGISSQTGYEGFLRADHQIEEETQLNFGQGVNASLSGEIIVGTGQTVTVNEVAKETVAVGNNGNKLWHNLVTNKHSGIIDGAYWNGSTFDFDGSNDVITGESCLTLFTNDTDHTIEMWVKFDDVTTRQTIISGYVSDSDRWDLEVGGGKLKGGHHDAGYFTSTASVVTGKWYHLVYVHDHASSLWRVFIDTATDVTRTNAGRDLTTPTPLGIGDRTNSSIGHLDGQISIVRIYSRELTSTEISTNYNLGQFSKETSVTDGLITHYNASNPSSYPGTLNAVDTTNTNIAGGSQIECMKVYNTFTPPSGGTNERPYKPKPGQLYYNYDFKTIEFHDGYGWRQVDNTTRSGRMVLGGGHQTSGAHIVDIQSFNINILGNSIDFGDLTINRSNIASCSSSIRGLFVGGANPSYKNIIDYVTMASAGNAIDFGDLSTTNRAYIGATSSSTRGIFGGGYTSSPSGATVNIIDYVEISTIGNALDFGDLFSGRYSAGAVSNGIRAVWAGGNTPGKSIIDFVTISSKGNSVFFGDLTYARRNAAGASFSSNVRGVFAGGKHPAVVGQIDYITIASEGNAIYFGDLSVTRQRSAGSSTQIRGVWAGGNTPNSSNVIDYVTIASTGNATDFGDLYKDTGSTAGCSDSHGGLGGF